MTQTAYHIENRVSGKSLGIYLADEPHDAVVAMCAEMPEWADELRVHEIDTSTESLQTLRAEADQAGDLEMVAICDDALLGDWVAILVCAHVIYDAICAAAEHTAANASARDAVEATYRAAAHGPGRPKAA
jgi:hypothetical protein